MRFKLAASILANLSVLLIGGVSTAAVNTAALAPRNPAAIYVPDSYDAQTTWPLVILLHGAGVNGDLQDLHFGLSERVSSQGFILAVPDARAPSLDVDSDERDDSDTAYILNLVSELKQQYTIDNRRVFLVGHSMGGYAALDLGCKHSDVFTGMVISAASGTCSGPSTRQEPISVLFASGSADISNSTIEATLAYWKNRNSCSTSTPTTAYFDFERDIFGAETAATSWEGCRANTDVTSWRSQFGRHVAIFNGNFPSMLLNYLLTHPREDIVATPAAINDDTLHQLGDCAPENDDRRRWIKETVVTAGQRVTTTIEEYADATCTTLKSKVELSGVAPAEPLGERAVSLRFDEVKATAYTSDVIDALNGLSENGIRLCNRAWQAGATLAVTTANTTTRQACIGTAGNILDAASFMKRSMLTFMFTVPR